MLLELRPFRMYLMHFEIGNNRSRQVSLSFVAVSLSIQDRIKCAKS